RFHSKLLPTDTDLRDARFHEKPSWQTPYKLTFHSDLYYEGQRGSLGFHLLLFAPLGLLGLAAARGRPLWSAAAVAFVAGGVVLSVEPNARYVYAAMPLCLIPAGAMLAWTREHQRVLYGAMLAALVATIGLDIWFLPSNSSYHKDFSLRLQLSRDERRRYVIDATPARAVIAYFNRAHARQPVMLVGDGSNAELDGDVYESHWHQLNNLLKIREAADLPALVRLMQSWKIQYFISRKPMPGETPDPPLWTDFL